MALFQLIIAFIIFLVLVIISGRILNEINKSKCHTSDANIQIAHKWAAWAVGISTAGLALVLIGIILIIVAKVETGGAV